MVERGNRDHLSERKARAGLSLDVEVIQLTERQCTGLSVGKEL